MGVKTVASTITCCNSGWTPCSVSGGWFIMYELLRNQHVKFYARSMHDGTQEKHPFTGMKMK